MVAEVPKREGTCLQFGDKMKREGIVGKGIIAARLRMQQTANIYYLDVLLLIQSYYHYSWSIMVSEEHVAIELISSGNLEPTFVLKVIEVFASGIC